MNGIEKIIDRINADTQAEIDAILAEARASADAIAAEYTKHTEQAAADICARGEAAAAQREERLISMAAMESRKNMLAAKQEMLAKAFALAIDKLCNLPDKDYVALLTKLVVAASSTGTEQLIFSSKDRARVGKAVVIAANNALPNGRLTLSEQTRPICGGVILRDGEVEVNCAFETLIRLLRSEISNEIANVLFA